MDWDDLRFFLAVAREGSLSGAARTLGVNHSTVFRRIKGFEDRIGVRLFDRMPSGYALTVAGTEMQETAVRVEEEVEGLDRRIAGQDLRLSGDIVVTTTDTMACQFLGPHLKTFCEAFPGINVDLVLDSQFYNLSKRQADIAIRPTLSPPETLVGRRLCAVAFACYAAPAYLATVDPSADLETHRWIAVDESLAHLAAAKWQRGIERADSVQVRSNNLLGLLGMAKAGLGVATLPCFMGDPEAGLTRVTDPNPELASALWLLTHQDLRATARVRAFLDFMAQSLASDIDLLEGVRGS